MNCSLCKDKIGTIKCVVCYNIYKCLTCVDIQGVCNTCIDKPRNMCSTCNNHLNKWTTHYCPFCNEMLCQRCIIRCNNCEKFKGCNECYQQHLKETCHVCQKTTETCNICRICKRHICETCIGTNTRCSCRIYSTCQECMDNKHYIKCRHCHLVLCKNERLVGSCFICSRKVSHYAPLACKLTCFFCVKENKFVLHRICCSCLEGVDKECKNVFLFNNKLTGSLVDMLYLHIYPFTQSTSRCNKCRRSFCFHYKHRITDGVCNECKVQNK